MRFQKSFTLSAALAMVLAGTVLVSAANALLAAQTTAATDAVQVNKPHQGRTSDCGKLKDPVGLVPLRYPDGTPTGFFVSGKYPVSQRQINEKNAPHREGCGPGTTEIDAREVVDSSLGKMVFHPGGPGYPYPGGTDKWGQYGHILLSDFAIAPPAPDPYNGQPVGNGVPLPLPKLPSPNYGVYLIKPTKIDDEMWYKKPHGKPTGAVYKNYGDKGHGGMYLVWNWVQNGSPSTNEADNHVPGGGYVRAVLKRDMKFERCDVAPLRTVSYGLNDAQNGWVTIVYGRVSTGKQWLYGWVIHSYEKWTPSTTASGEWNKKKLVEVLWPESRGPLPTP